MSPVLPSAKRRLESLESRRNLLITVSDPFILWSTQAAFAIEAQRQKFAPSFSPMVHRRRVMEALNALATMPTKHPEDSFPEFIQNGATFTADGLAQSMLPRAQSIRKHFASWRDLRPHDHQRPQHVGKKHACQSRRPQRRPCTLRRAGLRSSAFVSPLQVTASVCISDLYRRISRF